MFFYTYNKPQNANENNFNKYYAIESFFLYRISSFYFLNYKQFLSHSQSFCKGEHLHTN